MDVKKYVSEKDGTCKYVFNNVFEYASINKHDGKDIICLPSHTSCNLGCTFCHLTGDDVSTKNVLLSQTIEHVSYILNDNNNLDNDTILFSFMGAGDALLTPGLTIERMHDLKLMAKDAGYSYSRFGVASIVHSMSALKEFTDSIGELDVKFHYSLHNTDDEKRRKIVPGGRANIKDVLKFVSDNFHRNEIHYTPIDGVNDHVHDAEQLATLVAEYGVPVKLIKLAPKDGLTGGTEKFARMLEEFGITAEQYSPPGADIGASCGQFRA